MFRTKSTDLGTLLHVAICVIKYGLVCHCSLHEYREQPPTNKAIRIPAMLLITTNRYESMNEQWVSKKTMLLFRMIKICPIYVWSMLQSLNEKGEYNGRYNKTTLDMYAMFASTCLYFLLWLSDVLYSNSKVIMYSLQFVLDNYVERVHQKN